MALKLMAAFILLGLLSSAEQTYSKNDGIDAGAITWQINKWSPRPIEASTPNARQTGVTMEFRFRITTALAISNVIEIYFPAEFAHPTKSLQPYSVNPAIGYSAGSDVEIIVTQVALPLAAGAYGPFKIYTRGFTNGQIYDMTNSFAAFYVSDPINDSSDLSVTLVPNTQAVVNKSADLLFQLDIDFDLRKHDVLVLNLDSKWAAVDKPACVSVAVTSETQNYFKSVRKDDNLDCINALSEGRIYIYGLADDLDVSELGGQDGKLTLKLQIDDFVVPDADFPINQYSWYIDVLRWNTRNVVKRYKGDGPETSTGDLSIISWVPHSGYNQNEIVQNLTMYMDLTVKITNAIPSGGSMTVSLSNVDIKTPQWWLDDDQSSALSPEQNSYCYVKWISNAPTTCSVSDTTTLNVTFTNGLSSQQELSISMLVNFNNNSDPTIQVTSYYSSNIEIDKSTIQSPITLAESKISRALSYNLRFVDATNWAGIGDLNKTGDNTATHIYASARFSNDRTLNGRFDISFFLPGNTDGAADTSVFYSGSQFRVLYQLTDTPSLTTDLSAQTNVAVTRSETNLNFIVDDIDPTDSQTNNTGGDFAFFGFDGTNGTLLTLPRIASNKETRYETYLQAQTTSGNKYVSFHVLSIARSGFNSITSIRLCGNAARFEFQVPFLIDTTNADKSYVLEIKFTDDFDDVSLGTNIPKGNDFPYVPSSSFSSTSLVLSDDRTLQLTGQQQYQTSTTYQIYTAFQQSTGNTNQVISFELYYTFVEGDPSLRYTFLQNKSSEPDHSNNATNLGISAPGAAQTLDAAFAQQVYSNNVTVNQQNTAAFEALAGPDTYTFQFPQGFTLSGASMTISNGGAIITSTQIGAIYSSTNLLYSYPTIISTATCADTNCYQQVSGVSVSRWELSTAAFTFGGQVNANCSTDNTGNAVNKGQIRINSTGQGTTIESRGPTNYHQQLELTFITDNGVPTGGKFTVELDDNWKPTQDTCTTDLASQSDDVLAKCERVGNSNIFEITDFQGQDTSYTFTVTWNELIPPENITGSTVNYRFIDYIYSSFDIGTEQKIDEYANPTETTEVSVMPSRGNSNFVDIKTIPPNAGLKSVDLFLQFSLEHKVPTGSVIQITPPTDVDFIMSSDSNILKNHIFSTKLWSGVILSGNSLYITFMEELDAEEQIEIYIENAINNPQSQNTTPFRVKSDYKNTVVFDEDTLTDSEKDQRLLPFQAAISDELTNPSVSVTTYTSSENSDYTFTFTTPTNLTVSHEFLIKFPEEYDQYLRHPSLGADHITYKWIEPNTYYIRCTSEQLGDELECSVDHRMIRVKEIEALAAGQVVITIHDVANPAVQQTKNSFTIYLVQNQIAVAKAEKFTGIEIYQLAQNIDIKNIELSNDDAFNAGNYTISLFLHDLTLNGESNLNLKLPRQFNTNLARINFNDDYNCNLSYNELNSEPDTDHNVEQIQTCNVDYNLVTMQLPDNFSKQFDDSIQINYKVSNVANPEWGYTRDSQISFTWNFEINDSNVFTIKDIWTNQLIFSVNNVVTKQTVARSYESVNAAYLGFTKLYRGFKINNYNFISKTSQIQVQPGTQTEDIQISTIKEKNEPLAADRMKFSPGLSRFGSGGVELSITSAYDQFIMDGAQYEILFRVGARKDTLSGIYYINWDITETKFDESDEVLYDPPPKTLVEVGYKQKVIVTINNIPNIEAGYTSIPILVQVSNSPFEELIITIEPTADSESDLITINPSELVFGPQRNKRYFTVNVSSQFDINTYNAAQKLKLTSTGVDADAFQIPNEITFQVTNQNTDNSLPTVSDPVLTISGQTMTSFTLGIQSNSIGIIYWHVGPSGKEQPTQDAIKEKVGDYFELKGDKEQKTRTLAEVKPAAEDKNDLVFDSWTMFVKRQYKQHLQNFEVFGAISSNASSQSIEVNYLFGETTYNVWVFIQDYYGTNSSTVPTTATTSSMPNSAFFIINIAGNIDHDTLPDLRNISAQAIGIQPTRLVNGEAFTVKNTDGVISSTQFRWNIPPRRDINYTTPEQEVALDSTQDEILVNKIRDKKITYQLQFDSGVITTSSIATPAWTENTVPTQTEVLENAITSSMQCTTSGYLCGVCTVPSSTYYPNHNQIYLGLDYNNQPAPNNCVKYIAEQQTNLTISNLTANTQYRCYYQCFNNYPVWPNYIAYSQNAEGAILSVTATTLETEKTDKDSANLMTALIAVIFFLIQLGF